jgi:hypothetical protein
MLSFWWFSASLWRRREKGSTPGGVEGWPEIGHEQSSLSILLIASIDQRRQSVA